jgi:hypothetical protein
MSDEIQKVKVTNQIGLFDRAILVPIIFILAVLFVGILILNKNDLLKKEDALARSIHKIVSFKRWVKASYYLHEIVVAGKQLEKGYENTDSFLSLLDEKKFDPLIKPFKTWSGYLSDEKIEERENLHIELIRLYGKGLVIDLNDNFINYKRLLSAVRRFLKESDIRFSPVLTQYRHLLREVLKDWLTYDLYNLMLALEQKKKLTKNQLILLKRCSCKKNLTSFSNALLPYLTEWDRLMKLLHQSRDSSSDIIYSWYATDGINKTREGMFKYIISYLFSIKSLPKNTALYKKAIILRNALKGNKYFSDLRFGLKYKIVEHIQKNVLGKKPDGIYSFRFVISLMKFVFLVNEKSGGRF